MYEYNDRVLRCIDCSEEFVFSAGEQLFFADKGLRNAPKRCKPCKLKKRAHRCQHAGLRSALRARACRGRSQMRALRHRNDRAF